MLSYHWYLHCLASVPCRHTGVGVELGEQTVTSEHWLKTDGQYGSLGPSVPPMSPSWPPAAKRWSFPFHTLWGGGRARGVVVARPPGRCARGRRVPLASATTCKAVEWGGLRLARSPRGPRGPLPGGRTALPALAMTKRVTKLSVS